MIIDAHVHLERYSQNIADPKQRVNDLQKLMLKSSIDKAIVIQDLCATEYKPLHINALLEVVKPFKNIYVVGAIRITKNHSVDLKNVSKLLKQKKIVGIKLYTGYERFYPLDVACNKVYALAEKYGVPVIFHMGDTFGIKAPIQFSEPKPLDELAIKRPRLKIVIAHLGNPWMDQSMMIIKRHKNVYGDISGLVWDTFNSRDGKQTRLQLDRVIGWAGVDKLLFGTDWPCCSAKTYNAYIKNYVKFAKSLKLSSTERKALMGGNALKLFNLK